MEEIFTVEEKVRYIKQLRKERQQEVDSYRMKDISLLMGYSKYTRNEAMEMLEDVINNLTGSIPVRLDLSVEFYDSLRKNLHDFPNAYICIPLKVIWKQKEDIILVYKNEEKRVYTKTNGKKTKNSIF